LFFLSRIPTNPKLILLISKKRLQRQNRHNNNLYKNKRRIIRKEKIKKKMRYNKQGWGVLLRKPSNTHTGETTRKSRAPHHNNLPAQHHEPPRTGHSTKVSKNITK